MKHTKKLVISALFAALAFVATRFFAFPLPLGYGYANLGDCFAFLAGFCLGGPWGAAAAGVGISLADILSPYIIYAPVTFVIKALIALCGALAVKFVKNNKLDIAIIAAFSVLGEAIMVLGYLLFELAIYGTSAILSVPGNLTQAGVGIVTSTLLAVIFAKNKRLRELLR